MEMKFTESADEDLEYWKNINDQKILKPIRDLLEAIRNDPFRGIGKPEGLKYNWSGCWSRRINRKHRLIYNVESGFITVFSLKDHYSE